MNFKRSVLLPMSALALGALPLSASANCKLMTVSLPVTVIGLRPLLPAKINGEAATFMIDSGAFFSMITPANAARYRLPRSPLPFGMFVSGATGGAFAQVGTVETFTLAETDLHHLEFIVTGGEIGEGAAGVIGQNVLGSYDVDYDLAHGKVGLIHPEGCSATNLAYWAGDKPYSVIPMEDMDRSQKVHHTLAVVYLNGVRLTALLDTGAATSVISERAAARAGVTSSDPNVTTLGRSGGIGQKTLPVWLASFKSFKIGGEEIKNTKMMFGGLALENADMLLGADFFLSHHILVSSSQQKIYFTYNGGPVFMLNAKPKEVWGAGGTPPPKDIVAEPTDAASFALRGAASMSRRDYPAAIADLSRALETSPNNQSYLYERGRAYLGSNQPLLAMRDFDDGLRLKPDDVPVLIIRAQMRLDGHDKEGALRDLDAADRAAAKQDDVRLRLGQLYEAADILPAAIGQYDLWLSAHPNAGEMPRALNGRCWARALLGQDLERALADCNQALRLLPKDPMTLDSRGLVHLRRGELDAAIRDYDDALRLNPKLVWSLYGRGLAERRKGDSGRADADIAAAVAINPKLPDQIRRRGIEDAAAKG
jgi:tetratricopeptide (TPR) repeat protein